MPDQQDPPPQSAPTETRTKNSPPLTPPNTELNGADQRPSRKREREVSIEPGTTPKASDTDETGATESRETRTPAKRNKRTLESTKEEIEDGTGKAASRSRSRSHSVSPPLGVGVSPRQEIKIKVRQISRGVEDLNWQTSKALDKNQAQEIIASSTLAPPAEVDERPSEVEDAVIADVKDNDSQPPVQQEAEDKDTAKRVEGPDNEATSVNVAPAVHAHVRSQSESREKGLKRRYEDRGTSQGLSEGESASKAAPETSKRPRDDGDEDPNPRETKRPSPPPETKKPSPKPSSLSPKAAPKPTGFEAYASVSPFALAAKGPNIFSSGKNTPVSVFTSPGPSTSLSNFISTSGEASSSPPKSLKRSGFEAFALSSSPFSSVARSKSPVLGQTLKSGSRAKSPTGRSNSVNSNPFGQYAGPNQGFQGFGVPIPKRPRADSPPESSQSSLEKNSTANVLNPNQPHSSEEDDNDSEKERSFGEKLRAAKDEDEDGNRSEEEAKTRYAEQEGEEDDRTIYQVRSKLFSLENGEWRERGTGLLKLNVRHSDGTGARLVMRRDAVYTLLLNVMLFHGMACALVPQDPRYLRFSAIENGSTTHYNLRLASTQAAQDLLKKITSNIPPA